MSGITGGLIEELENTVKELGETVADSLPVPLNSVAKMGIGTVIGVATKPISMVKDVLGNFGGWFGGKETGVKDLAKKVQEKMSAQNVQKSSGIDMNDLAKKVAEEIAKNK